MRAWLHFGFCIAYCLVNIETQHNTHDVDHTNHTKATQTTRPSKLSLRERIQPTNSRVCDHPYPSGRRNTRNTHAPINPIMVARALGTVANVVVDVSDSLDGGGAVARPPSVVGATGVPKSEMDALLLGRTRVSGATGLMVVNLCGGSREIIIIIILYLRRKQSFFPSILTTALLCCLPSKNSNRKKSLSYHRVLSTAAFLCCLFF